jgi:hypothetical protein
MSNIYNFLLGDLQKDEDVKYEVYPDPVKENKPTAGMGHLLTDEEKAKLKVGDKVSPEQVQAWAATDITRAVDAARKAVPDFDKRPMEFQRGVANAMYQLGGNMPKKFPKAFQHLSAGNIEDGIRELSLNDAGDGPSLWATQTPNRFKSTTDMIRASLGAPSSGGGGPTAPKPELQPAQQQEHLRRQIADNIPESWFERRGDEMEMGIKAIGSGLLSTASLLTRWADLGFDFTDTTADWLEGQADSIRQSLPQWIQDDIHKKVFKPTADGGWEFDMPSLRAIANLTLESVGPGGFIGIGGKIAAKTAAKRLPQLFEAAPKLAPAAAYGGVNAAYIATDSYQNAYEATYGQAISEGLSEEEAKKQAEVTGQFAAMVAGPLSLVTGTVGGLAMRGSGLASRIAKGAALGAASEAVEEPGQYVAEQLAMGRPIDPLEVASRAMLGALASGPMEGAMAGMAGTDTNTAAGDLAAAAGAKLIDDMLAEPTANAEQLAREQLSPENVPIETIPEGEALPETLPLQPDPTLAPLPDIEADMTGEAPGMGEPVDLTLPAAPARTLDPTSDEAMDILMATEKLTGPQLRKELRDAGETGYSKQKVWELKKRVHDLRVAKAEAAATTEEVPNSGLEPEPTAEKPKLTKKEQKQLDKIQAKVDEAEAQAKLDAMEKEERTPQTAEEEMEQADAAIEAYAAKQGGVTRDGEATGPTTEEVKAETLAEAEAEAATYKGVRRKKELAKRNLPTTGNAAEQHTRLAEAIYEEKIAPVAPLTAEAAPEATAAVATELETEVLGKLQKAWDKGIAAIKGAPMKVLRGMAEAHGITKPPRKKKDLIAAIIEAVPDRPTELSVEAKTALSAPVQETQPTSPTPAESTALAADSKPATDDPLMPMTRDRLKAKTNKIEEDVIQKHWGKEWKAKVYRVAVGSRVFTMWKGPEGLAGTFNFVEGEPKDFNPTVDGTNSNPTYARSLTAAKAYVEEKVNREHELVVDEFLANEAAQAPPDKDQAAAIKEVTELVDEAVRKNLIDDDLFAVARRVSEISEPLRANVQTLEAMKRQYARLSARFEKSRSTAETRSLAEVMRATFDTERADQRRADKQAETEAERAEYAQRLKRIEDMKAAEQAAITTRSRMDQMLIAAENKRGLSMASARYWFHHQMRKFTGRGEMNAEDATYKESHPVEAARLENSTLSEVMSRALASQKHKWIVRLQNKQLALRERQELIREVIAEHNAELNPADPNYEDKLWEWTDQMDVYQQYDQQDAKVGSLIDNFNKEHQKPFAAALEAAGVAPAQLNDYLVAVHALWRNAYLQEKARVKGGKGRLAMSGVTNEMAQATLDRLTPDAASKAKYEQLFKDHIQPMTALQRSIYREHNLVPDAILDKWEPSTIADIYNVPTTGADLLAKLEAGFRSTYIPLQHTPTDLNLDMVEANLRKTDLAGVGDVYGDEVKAAEGQTVKDTMPQHALAQLKTNIIKAYVRAAHNDTIQATAELAKKHPSLLMWSVVEGDNTYVDDPLTGDPVEVPFTDPEASESWVPGQDLRKASGLTTFRDTEMTTLRYKTKEGKPGILRIHDALLATALAPEISLNNWPMRNLGKLSRWVSSINTTYSPGFMIVNPMRDFVSAKVQMSEAGKEHVRKHISVKNYKRVLSAYWAELRGEPHDGSDPTRVLIDRYRAAGGHTQFYRPERLQDHVRSLEADMADVRKAGGEKSIKTFLHRIPGIMRDTNTALENAARLLAFEAAITIEGKNGKVLSDQKAADMSKNLVVNFGRRGTWGPSLNALYPFYNASVQGNAILYRTWKRSPNVRKATYGLAAIGLANGVMQEMLSGEDDDGRSRYANLSPHVKERNLVFFIPGTEDYVKVPLPYGLNVPVVIGNAMASMFAGNGDPVREIMNTINAAKGSFNPIASSTMERTLAPLVMEPYVDMKNNRNFFGSPINPDRMGFTPGQKTDAFNVRDPDANKISTAIAQQVAYMTGGNAYRPGLVDIGPGTLRYMWDFALGSAGSTVRRTIDALTADTLHDAGVKIPVIRRLYGTMTDFRHKERYYDMREELSSLKNEREMFRANRRAQPEAYADFMREHGDYWERGVMGQFDRTERRLRTLIRDKNKLRNVSDKTQAQRDRLERYNKRIDDTVVRFNSYYYNKFILGDRG